MCLIAHGRTNSWLMECGLIEPKNLSKTSYICTKTFSLWSAQLMNKQSHLKAKTCFDELKCLILANNIRLMRCTLNKQKYTLLHFSLVFGIISLVLEVFVRK